MKNKSSIKIMMTGGGTGGHIFPLISVARELKKLEKERSVRLDIVFIGPSLKGKMFSDEGFIAKHLITGKLRRYLSFKTFTDTLKLLVGFTQAAYYLIKYRPNLIFSKGGYGSFPTVIMGWLMRIPVISHESDSIAGAANRLLSKFSKNIIVSFPGDYPELPAGKIIRIGNPVRDMRNGDAGKARVDFSLTNKLPVIFIIGGSQGSAQINNLIGRVAPKLNQRFEILHQTGKNKNELQELENYCSVEFLSEQEMKNAYALSDIIISRAGSGSIFEIALVGKPSILIPLKHDPSGHQNKNAKIYEGEGACVYLDPNKADPETLLENILSLMDNQEKREAMSRAAKTFANPSAAQDIATLLLEYLDHGK